MKNVLIGAGHRNKQGGNPYEAEMNGKKVRAILDLFDAQGGSAKLGFDLRTYTPDRGLGWSDLDLNEVPVTGFQDKAWPVDLMVELHSEGGGGKEGAFVIFPDWGADVDVDVRDHGTVFVDALHEAAGFGYRVLAAPGGKGLMSETQTGVAIQYDARLGVFRDTAQFNAKTSRMIFEQGAHDEAGDRAIMDSPNYLLDQASAFLDGVVLFFDAIAPGWRAVPEAPVTFATPAAIPFTLGVDLGWQKIGNTDVYSFVAQGTARDRVIKRAWAQDSAPVSGEAYLLGDRITLCGYLRAADVKDPTKRIQWYLDKDGNRIRWAKVATAFQIKE